MTSDRGRPSTPHFGEEDAKLSYGSYLAVDELLRLQRLESDPPAHDELLFIVVHQVYELWFKLCLFELEAARDAMFGGDVPFARHLLNRVHSIEKVLIEQIGVLEAMAPIDFLEFRQNLAPASGFQSVQFREIEFLSGLKNAAYIDRLSTDEDEGDRLRRRLREPSLWDAFCHVLTARGLPMPAGDEEVRRTSLKTLLAQVDARPEEFYLSESLLTHDELFAKWRYHHVLMVERQIGSKTGTGGSTGASYLRTTLDKRFYPELWAARSFL
jgi:tryptophan 2,3-dioxygenase